MRKILCITLLAMILSACSTYKLSDTMWYNYKAVFSKGTAGTVGTSLYFNGDSSVVIFKGVAIDTIVAVSPTVYALGSYQCQKVKGKIGTMSMSLKNGDNEKFVYSGTYDKKNGEMILYTNDSILCGKYVLCKNKKH